MIPPDTARQPGTKSLLERYLKLLNKTTLTERDTERDTHRHIHRETETETETQTQIQRDRDTETETHRELMTEYERNGTSHRAGRGLEGEWGGWRGCWQGAKETREAGRQRLKRWRRG